MMGCPLPSPRVFRIVSRSGFCIIPVPPMFRFLSVFIPAWLVAWCLESGGCLIYIHAGRGGFGNSHFFHQFNEVMLMLGPMVAGAFALHTLAECLLLAALLALPLRAPLRYRPRIAWLAALLIVPLSLAVQIHTGRLILTPGIFSTAFPVVVIAAGCLSFCLVYSILSVSFRSKAAAIGNHLPHHGG